jgi:putative membrane protein
MGPERLHRAGIAVYALNTLREAAFPLLALFAFAVLGSGFDSEALVRGAIYAVGGTLVAGIAGYVRWINTHWSVRDESIHFRSGIFSVKETDVPLSRIQSLDLEQGPVQRLFGVYAVHVQTGGGGARGEIVLDAVGPGAVQALRDLLARRRPEAAGPAPAPDAERRLTRRMLLVAALTAGQVGVLLPVLAAAGQIAESFLGDGDRSDDAIRLLPDTASEALVVAAALLGAAWLLSMLGAVVAFAGFTVTRDGDRLRIRRGLLQRREATLPVERVRAVEIVEGVLRRPFGLATVRIEVIGHAKEATAAQALFPILRRAEWRPFLDRFLPELADDPAGLAPPPRRALRRYVLPPAAAGLAAGALAWALAPAGPWPLLATLPAAGYGVLRFRSAGWRLEGGRLAVRSLLFARTTVLAPAAYRESHDISQTPLQRRARLADLAVEFGKSTTASIRHIELAAAAEAWSRIARSSGTGYGARSQSARRNAMYEARLKDVPFFSTLDRKQLDIVAQQTDEVDVREGEVLVRQGELGQEFFIVESGTAEASIDGRHIREFGPGDFFGEMALLEEERRTATVTATSPMVVIVMTRASFRALDQTVPTIHKIVHDAIAERRATTG